MDAVTFGLLRKIREKHGAGEFGKITQKLLGIVLSRLCFDVKERSVQDVDLEAVRTDLKYWIEVKTTDKDEVPIKEKDDRCLKQCEQLHGGITAYAILKVSLLSNWIIASSRNINPGIVRIGKFSTQMISPLQSEINKLFPSVVKEYGAQILAVGRDKAQFVVDKLLKNNVEKKKLK